MNRKESRQSEEPALHVVQSTAEWITLTVSAALIALLAGFLAFNASRAESDYVETRVEVGQAAKRMGDAFVLPVEVRNLGNRTLRSLTIEVTLGPAGPKQEKREIELDYLGEGETEKLFLYLDRDPAGSKVEGRPLHYLLD